MPELPEVEAVVTKLRPGAEGSRIAAVRVLRARATHPQSPDKLTEAVGHTIRRVERRGKHILMHLTSGLAVRIHLRMTGNVTVLPSHVLHSDTARVVFALRDGRGIAYEDPRMLGTVHLHTERELEALLADLGVEPLSDEFTVSLLATAARRSRKPVKVWLMDQHPVAGLGNIYAAESLFRARIHPAKPANQIGPKRIAALHNAIREVLTEAIPDALASYSLPGSHDGMHLCVYDREGEPCPVCGRAVRRIRQAGRSTYYCASCQK